MSKASTKTVVVIGATGAMGRPVVRQLLADPEHPWHVRAFTRDPASRHARALVDLDPARVELARGDLNDAAALGRALAGADAVFCNTDFWSSLSVETEFEQGTRVLEAARAAGVGHVVYSSLDDCTQLSGGRLPVPHYDAKAAVEHAIDRRRSDEFMRRDRDGFYSRHVSVLVTGPYYENLCNFFLPARGRLADGREGLTFSLAAGDQPFPMVALDDIAWFAAHLLARPDEWGGRTLPIMSESLTLAEAARTFEAVTGIPAEYRPVPLEAVREGSPVGHDLANMFQFIQEVGWRRDYAALRRLHPGLRTFRDWLVQTGWRGEARAVQKGAVTGDAA